MTWTYRILLLATFLGITACAESNLHLETRITNESFEKSLSNEPLNRDQKIKLFEGLRTYASPVFNWKRFWTDLASRNLGFSSSDDEAWEAVWALTGLSCRDQRDLEAGAFYEYLMTIRPQWKSEGNVIDPVAKFNLCQRPLKTPMAIRIWNREINETNPSREILAMCLPSLDVHWMNAQPKETWDKVAQVISEDLVEGKIPSESTRKLSNTVMNVRGVSQDKISSIIVSTLLSDNLTHSSPLSQSNQTSVSLIMASLDEAKKSHRFSEWATRALPIISEAFYLQQITLEQALSLNGEILSELNGKAGLIAFANEEQLRRWLSAFDASSDRMFLALRSEQAREDKFILRFDQSVEPTIQEIWIATLLQGTLRKPKHQAYLKARSKSRRPLDKWISHRISLRNSLTKDFDEIHGAPPFDGKGFWGSLDQCPIPRMNLDGEFIFDRPWTPLDNENQSLALGCYKIVAADFRASSSMDSTYDSMIYAPSARLRFAKLDRAIVDVSGEVKNRYSPELVPSVNGASFPVVFVSSHEGVSTHTKNFVVYHFVAQFPSSPKLAEGWSANPDVSSNGGVVEIDEESSLPVWMRSFAAPETMGHEMHQGGLAAMAQKVQLFSRIQEGRTGGAVDLNYRDQRSLPKFLGDRLGGTFLEIEDLPEAALKGAPRYASYRSKLNDLALPGADLLRDFLQEFGTIEAAKAYQQYLALHGEKATALIEAQFKKFLRGEVWDGAPEPMTLLLEGDYESILAPEAPELSLGGDGGRGKSGSIPKGERLIYSHEGKKQE